MKRHQELFQRKWKILKCKYQLKLEIRGIKYVKETRAEVQVPHSLQWVLQKCYLVLVVPVSVTWPPPWGTAFPRGILKASRDLWQRWSNVSPLLYYSHSWFKALSRLNCVNLYSIPTLKWSSLLRLHTNYSSFFHLLICYLFLWPHSIPPLPAQAHVAVSLPWVDSALTHRVVIVCVISPVYSCLVSYNLAIWSTAVTSFNLFHLSVSTELVNFDLEGL